MVQILNLFLQCMINNAKSLPVFRGSVNFMNWNFWQRSSKQILMGMNRKLVFVHLTYLLWLYCSNANNYYAESKILIFYNVFNYKRILDFNQIEWRLVAWAWTSNSSAVLINCLTHALPYALKWKNVGRIRLNLIHLAS